MKKLLLVFALIFSTAVMAKNLYVRTNSDATSWSNITLGSGDELVTLPLGDSIKTFLSVSGDSIIYFAPGTYTLPKLGATFVIKTNGKVYGGFSGTESTIDLNARTISDKDGNGIVEPWEFTNEAIITTSNPNFKFTGAGISSGSRLLTVSGTGAEVNGVTLTDFNYLTYAGPISIGKGADVPAVADNVSGKEGILRLCTVKKMKGAKGIIISTNKFSIIDRCLIESNISSNLGNWGGAVFLNLWGGKVTGCVIRNNASTASTGRAAGILANSAASYDMDAIVENCVVYNNFAGASGAGIRGEAQANKRGIEIINCTVVNNQTGATVITADGSVTLVNGGTIVNSIIVGDPSAEIRANLLTLPAINANYVSCTAYGESATGASTLYGSNNVSGKVVVDFNFTTPTTSAGVMIPDYTTPYDAAKYNAIRQANFKITASSSVAATAVSTKSYPANYLIGGTGATVTLSTYSIPSTDILGVTRPISTNGHLDLGAYQFSGLTTSVANANLSKSDIYAFGDDVVITNAIGSAISIYSLTGQLVEKIKANSNKVTIATEKGIYIVKVDSRIVKVIVN